MHMLIPLFLASSPNTGDWYGTRVIYVPNFWLMRSQII